MNFLCFLLLPLFFGTVMWQQRQTVQAIDPDFNLNDMMNKQNCPNFKCSAGHTPVPKSRGLKKFESMGCSSMGGGAIMMTGGGDGGGEKPYETCCDQWHACYQICGMSKNACDTAFETCAKDACGIEYDTKCKQDVEINTMMMKLSGCQKFNEAQYRACECTPNERAMTKRRGALEYFYKKYSPDTMDKVEHLAKKADTTKKMANLLMKLLQKYPEAIQKIEDPMKKMYDKIRMNSDTETNDHTTSVTEEMKEDDSDFVSEEDHIEL